MVLRGSAPQGHYLRIIGGGGDDMFVDSSSVTTGPTASFYDARGDVDKSPGNGISIDQHRFRTSRDSVSDSGTSLRRLRGFDSRRTTTEPVLPVS